MYVSIHTYVMYVTYVCTHVHMTNKYVHTYLHKYIHIRILTCMYACITYTHTYAHIHKHTHITTHMKVVDLNPHRPKRSNPKHPDTPAVATREVTALAHEPLDNTVEL